MMKDDILAGLKNAVGRGESLAEAVQSFINAGYTPQDVKESAESFSRGIKPEFRTETAPEAEAEAKPEMPSPSQPQQPSIQPAKQVKPGKKNTTLIVLLIIALLILVGTAIVLVFYRQDIFNFINSLFS